MQHIQMFTSHPPKVPFSLVPYTFSFIQLLHASHLACPVTDNEARCIHVHKRCAKQTKPNKCRPAYIHPCKRTDRHTDRQTDRRAGRQAGAGRQTDRQAGGYRPFCGGTVRFTRVPSVLPGYRPFLSKRTVPRGGTVHFTPGGTVRNRVKRTVPRGGTVHFGKTDGTLVKWTVPSWNRVFPFKVASPDGRRGAPAGSCPRTPPRKAPKGRRRNPI